MPGIAFIIRVVETVGGLLALVMVVVIVVVVFVGASLLIVRVFLWLLELAVLFFGRQVDDIRAKAARIRQKK